MKRSKTLTDDQYAFAQSVAVMRAENKMLNNRVARLTKEYDELWKVFVVILVSCEDRELRIHRTQMVRLLDEYRVQRWEDASTEEYVWKLKGITDD